MRNLKINKNKIKNLGLLIDDIRKIICKTDTNITHEYDLESHYLPEPPRFSFYLAWRGERTE